MIADHPLRGALTNATYEFLGETYRSLLDDARRESPAAHGPALAAKVLALLHPDLALDAQREGDAFFIRWLQRHKGDLPQVHRRERVSAFFRAEDGTMETEDLRWVGLAVLIAFAGGALVLLLRKRSNDGPAPPMLRPQPNSAPKPQPIRFAVAVFSGKVRDAGATAAAASDLLTHSAFWWVGGVQSWDGIVRAAHLTPNSDIPDTDDALIVLLFEAAGTAAETPSSRSESASRLRDAARRGELFLLGMFTASDPAVLGAAGFRR